MSVTAEDSSKTDTNLNWRINEWFPSLDIKIKNQLKLYFDELIKFNKVVNLISSKSVAQADSIHFADSILSSQSVHKKINKNSILYDIGSGNGFPGLVYSILYPDQKVTLVDSDERKCEFLKHIATTVGLSNTTILNKKLEGFAPNTIEQAICRGFAPLPRLLLTLRKIVIDGGNVFHLKADEWGLEVSQIPIQLCSIWQPALESEYSLPHDNIKLFVIRTDKLKSS